MWIGVVCSRLICVLIYGIWASVCFDRGTLHTIVYSVESSDFSRLSKHFTVQAHFFDQNFLLFEDEISIGLL